MALTLEQVQVLIKAETGPYKKALEDIKNQTANAQKETESKAKRTRGPTRQHTHTHN